MSRIPQAAFVAVEISTLLVNVSPARAITPALHLQAPADRECCYDTMTPPCGWRAF